jgi:hypothetical protein
MKASLVVFFYFALFSVIGQTLTREDSLMFESEISCVCSNFRNELFFGLESGEIVKATHQGSILEKFSYPNTGTPTHITCSNPMKVFVFYEETQSYLLLERFAVAPKIYQLDTDMQRRVDHMIMTSDQSLWMVTSPDLMLHRRTENQSIGLYQLNAIINSDDKINGLYPLSKMVSLVSDQRIMYFNLAGQLISKLHRKPNSIALSHENSIFIIDSHRLVEYTVDDQYTYEIESSNSFDSGMRISDEQFILIKESQVAFYRLR